MRVHIVKKAITLDSLKLEQKGTGFFTQEPILVCHYHNCVISISRGKHS